jgi:hypothetical protein
MPENMSGEAFLRKYRTIIRIYSMYELRLVPGVGMSTGIVHKPRPGQDRIKLCLVYFYVLLDELFS